MKLKWNTKCKLCLLPSLAGILVFFVIPYIRVLYYSLIENQFSKKFVGLKNYVDIIQNPYFRLAFKNSVLLIALCVPALILLALVISLSFAFIVKEIAKTRVAFILPMLLPTASIALVWNAFFGGFDNVLPLYLLFIWKNIGICIIFLTAAFTTLDESMLEAAKLDGTGGLRLHIRITIPAVMPAVLFCVLLSIVNTFKIFKESYLYYGGNYPPTYAYSLQYYMNNNFLKFNYQALATSSILTSLVVLVIVGLGFVLQRRYQQ